MPANWDPVRLLRTLCVHYVQDLPIVGRARHGELRLCSAGSTEAGTVADRDAGLLTMMAARSFAVDRSGSALEAGNHPAP